MPCGAVRALWRSGFDGIRYALRHDPTGDEIGYPRFGPGGASAGPGTFTAAPITTDLLVRGTDRWGLTIGP